MNRITIKVRSGDIYRAVLRRKDDGCAYTVYDTDGIVVCQGWTLGTAKDGKEEAMFHLEKTISQAEQAASK